MRDLDENPYSPDEARIAKFFFDKGTGGGDDPIGALIASHEYMAVERNAYRSAFKSVIEVAKQKETSINELLGKICP